MDWLKELVIVAFGFALGFVSQRYWDSVSRKREKERQEEDEKKEDERILREVRRALLEVNRTWKSTTPPRQFIESMDELSQLSMEIKREENKIIKLDIWRFSGKFREAPSHSLAIPEVKELRIEAEELRKKIEEILGIVELEQNNGSQRES